MTLRASRVSRRALYQYLNIHANICIKPDDDKEKLSERGGAKLSHRVAVIKFGAATEIKTKKEKARAKLEGANEDQTVDIRILS